MFCILRIEDVNRERRRQRSAFTGEKQRAWVARITGYDKQFGYMREFMPSIADYSASNSVGSRGVMLVYTLDSGIYEVSAPRSWKKTDRYFMRVSLGRMQPITEDDVKREIGLMSFLKVKI